jgi:integrase/transposase-like protein
MSQLAFSDIKPCLNCGNTKLRKNGVTKKGIQKYKCKGCHKTYTETSYYPTENQPSDSVHCPRCNSTNHRSGGKTRDGRKRYICRDCNRCYQENPKFIVVREVITGIECPRCQSQSVTKAGTYQSGKKAYKCKDCKRTFVENPDHLSSRFILPKNITSEKMFDYDTWDGRILGVKPNPSTGKYTFNFASIQQDWLKLAAKKSAKYKASIGRSFSNTDQTLYVLNKFSRFLCKQYPNLKPEFLNREIVVNFIIYLNQSNLKPTTLRRYIDALDKFLQDCQRLEFCDIPKTRFIFKEDHSKEPQNLPRFIPEEIIKQLEDNLDALAEPIRRCVLVLRETGMRISELCSLKINCIRQDSTGDYWITLYQIKMKKEISLNISKDLAGEILTQQKYIKDNIGEKFKYLFCNTEHHSSFASNPETKRSIYIKERELTYFQPIAKKLRQDTVRGYLHKLAREKNITDASGQIYPLGRCHQFRHTHGTELINANVPQHIVQKRLGHASPEMTSRYAHIHDKTMKQKMEEFWDGRVFNNQGEVVVSENPELDTAGMQWIKRNMKAQTLPDGFCGLPVTQSCPVQGSPCLTCSHLRTTVEFLDVHRKRLEEAEKLIENARANGWNRQVETNLPIAENLRKIIRGLEQKEVIHGDEKFPKQEGGKQSA